MIKTGTVFFKDASAPKEFDLLVIGGGITGCGVALDAAMRGHRVLVVEQHDLGAHTSSRSSKLVHGGIRYLEQFDFGLVQESLSEQKRLISHIAPYHVKPLPFTMPLSGFGFTALYMRIGTALYDFLGKRKGNTRSKLFGNKGLKERLGFLKTAYKAGLEYHDALMEDVRLVYSVTHTASERGAYFVTRTRLASADKTEAGFAINLQCGPDLDVKVFAKKVILAAGVYANQLQDIFGEAPVDVLPSKGSHILVARDRLPGKTAMVAKTAKSVLFCIPFPHHWVIGTTEGSPKSIEDGERPSESEIDYLIAETNKHVKDPLTRADIIGAFAGVRPLVKASTKDSTKLSRNHVVTETEKGAVLITGGKYTTYRVMAEDAVSKAFNDKRSVTADLPLWGAVDWISEQKAIANLIEAYPVTPKQAERLVHRYGTKAAYVLECASADNRSLEPVCDKGPLWAEILFAITHEGAANLEDILHRRVRMDLDMKDAGLSIAPTVLETLQRLAPHHIGDPQKELEAFMNACSVIRPPLT